LAWGAPAGGGGPRAPARPGQPRPSRRGAWTAAASSALVSSGRGVGEGAAEDVEVPEVSGTVGQRGRRGDRGPVDQGLPVGVHGGGGRRIAPGHPHPDPLCTPAPARLVI